MPLPEPLAYHCGLMVPVKVLVPWTEPAGYVKQNVTWFRLIVPNIGPVVG